jgi:hypothetical protein
MFLPEVFQQGQAEPCPVDRIGDGLPIPAPAEGIIG